MVLFSAGQNADGAAVWLVDEGHQWRRMPLPLRLELPEGRRYTVRAIRPGYRDFVQQLGAAAPHKANVVIALEPDPEREPELEPSPAPPVAIGEPHNVVRRAAPRIRNRCWLPLVGSRPELSAARLTLSLSLDEEGTVDVIGPVSTGRADIPEAADPVFVDCVLRELAQLRFAKTSERTTLNLPLVFRDQ